MIFRIKRTVLILCLCPLALVWASQPKYVGLTEVWAYLMDGEERFYTPDLPVTDIGYFGAGIGRYGNLVGVPDRDKLANSPARIHLVVAEVSGNYGLSHFILNPDYGVRDRFIEFENFELLAYKAEHSPDIVKSSSFDVSMDKAAAATADV